MIAAVALVAYLVQPGDTLSGIAASHGVSVAAVEAANAKVADPDIIYAGQTVEIPAGSSATQATQATQGSYTTDSSPTQYSGSQRATSGASSSGTTGGVTSSSSSGSPSSSPSGYSSGSLSDISGVPQSFAACVASRESTNLQDPAANGNAYGIIPASGYNVSGTSLAHQKQVFAQLYQQYGGSPWAADGCPGT